MSFSQGFRKTASTKEFVSKALTEAIEGSKAFGKGIYDSGASTIGETLRLKGLKHIPEAMAAHGGLAESLKSSAGRKAIAEGLGKSVPSVAAAGLYAGLGYNAYKKLAPGYSYDPYAYYGY